MKLTQATAIHLPYLQSYRKEEKCWSSLSKKYLLVFFISNVWGSEERQASQWNTTYTCFEQQEDKKRD
jgi:hypothetical protein